MAVGRAVMECWGRLDSKDVIISGGCSSGADWWAKTKCMELGRTYVEVPAIWRPKGVFNPKAGIQRNRIIAELATHMVAFWDGRSTGTAHVMNCMYKLGKPVWIVYV